jgi:hypothetical protein
MPDDPEFDRYWAGQIIQAYAMWAEATEAIQKYGSMVKSPLGYPVESPYVSTAIRQGEIMMRNAPRIESFEEVAATIRATWLRVANASPACWNPW